MSHITNLALVTLLLLITTTVTSQATNATHQPLVLTCVLKDPKGRPSFEILTMTPFQSDQTEETFLTGFTDPNFFYLGFRTVALSRTGWRVKHECYYGAIGDASSLCWVYRRKTKGN